jgi:hypothetical protein
MKGLILDNRNTILLERPSPSSALHSKAAKKAGNNAQVVSLCGDQPLADAAAQPLHSSKQSMIQERVRAGIADDRVARAEQIVEMLRSRYRFNEQRAVLLLDSSRRLDFDNGDCPEMTTVLDWVRDHNQSLDWIIDGDSATMICRLAAQVMPLQLA